MIIKTREKLGDASVVFPAECQYAGGKSGVFS
jgi:hypothetical protein